MKSVDATEAQHEEVKAILGNSIDTLLPIAQNPRDYREELRAELTKPPSTAPPWRTSANPVLG